MIPSTAARHVALLAAMFVTVSACSNAPSGQSLRDSFAQQLSGNKFIAEFKRSGDEMTFSGPTADGGKGTWSVHIDSAVIDANTSDVEPFKGTIKSTWSVNGQPVRPSGSESNLPLELMANGLSQDCWALWNKTDARWGWD